MLNALHRLRSSGQGAVDKAREFPQEHPELVSTLKRILIPALAAGAGAGALTGYTASQDRPRNETPYARRRRIMRKAMMGAALGGTAAATLPTGLKMVSGPFTSGRNKVPLLERGFDIGIDAGIRNAGPLAALGFGGYHVGKNIYGKEGHRAKAISHLVENIKGNAGLPTEVTNPEQLKGLWATKNGPLDVLSAYTSKVSPNNKHDLHSFFKGNEWLQEAGHKGISLNELSRMPNATPDLVRSNYRSFLGDQGITGRLLSKLVRPNFSVAGREFNPTAVAETLAKYVRPSIGGRMAPIAQLGLLGGGALLAKKFQDRLLGS